MIGLCLLIPGEVWQITREGLMGTGFHLAFLALKLLRVRVLLQAAQALCPLGRESLNHQLVQNTHLGFNGQRLHG